MAARNDNITKDPAAAGRKSRKRGKEPRTIIKEKLGLNNIEDMKNDVLNVWKLLIAKGTKKEKAFAAKEMSKYLFAQKRELSGELNGKIEIKINYGSKDEG